VLSFEFWQLPTSAIWTLSWRVGDDNRTWTDELLADEQLKPIALFFIRLSHLAATETLEAMFDYLIGSVPLNLNEPAQPDFTSPYYGYYFGDIAVEARDGQKNDFWNLLTNLIVLRARLHEYRKDGDERLGLADFIEFVEAMRAAELKILNTSPYTSGTDAVQLMTAFKAKGMEWSAVFVLAVNDEAWGGKSHNASSRDPVCKTAQLFIKPRVLLKQLLWLFEKALGCHSKKLGRIGGAVRIHNCLLPLVGATL